ncbi:hypothetical protein MGSAQ_000587 [marine sediment metagenome]|uniref:Uncharacterized protein n=1 Tax=marine sediment metagenome TaxID=412755 RepID=A0A1B6NYN3_9ZZZZ
MRICRLRWVLQSAGGAKRRYMSGQGCAWAFRTVDPAGLLRHLTPR